MIFSEKVMIGRGSYLEPRGRGVGEGWKGVYVLSCSWRCLWSWSLQRWSDVALWDKVKGKHCHCPSGLRQLTSQQTQFIVGHWRQFMIRRRLFSLCFHRAIRTTRTRCHPHCLSFTDCINAPTLFDLQCRKFQFNQLNRSIVTHLRKISWTPKKFCSTTALVLSWSYIQICRREILPNI